VKAGIGPTPYARWGDWVSLVGIGVVLALVALAWFRPIGARSDPGTPWR
jgi:apolipoprotein N-acyltransferase